MVDKALRPRLRNEFQGPFEDVFSQLIESFFNEFSTVQTFESRRSYPKVDIFRMGNDLVFEAAVPGMKREWLEVNVEDGVLTIKGESQTKLEPSSEGDRNILGYCLMRELKRSSFIRRFTLPKELSIVNLDAAGARLEDGVLEVRFINVYEKEKEQPKLRTINIK